MSASATQGGRKNIMGPLLHRGAITRMWANAERDGPLPNIGGALCSTPQRLVAPSARAPCSNAANRRAQDLRTQSEFCTCQNFVTGQQPPKMYTLSIPTQVTATHHAKFGWLPLSDVTACNEAKTRKLLKLAGVPQTNETISAASGPKFTIL